MTSNQTKRLIFIILMFIPVLNIIGSILYLLTVRCSGVEKIIVLLGLIPFISIVCAVILIINFVMGGQLLSPRPRN
ncbi:hypothetical protein [Malacoplasma iowae]|uniref:Uncharacterized protein n=2 Tax=Malacoplasma iowae TaxID=2116 RepID=A0A6P1LD61_MALIO|nr:hypothetical protein [Malacoplasma iowae]QHG89544.1 hypothetical protein EER00_01345 [Malacoplasma iowae 695]WPL37998.1 hypothetical protein QX182_00520 [Malacoplasma iowae]VEU63134.1 Uncharacterised protein [Mycoplasmopsis fermentans]VEU71870.1 Uncharacterised protein [Malacoplasma iowae]